MSAESQNVPTFKLVLGKHIVACYLVTPITDHFLLNFLIDNDHSVLDGLISHLLAFLPHVSSEILLDYVQSATVELGRPLLSR